MQYAPALRGEIFRMNFGKYRNGSGRLIPAVNDPMINKP